MPKFGKGAKLIQEDGSEESLEGVEFSVRPMTNLVRIAAHRAVKALDSEIGVELQRASFKTFRGQPVAPMFPEFSLMNLDATYQANQAMAELNGDGEGPLVPKTTGAP